MKFVLWACAVFVVLWVFYVMSLVLGPRVL
jgi:hypothetical protein